MMLSSKQKLALSDLPIIAHYNESAIPSKQGARYWVGKSGVEHHPNTIWSLVNRNLVKYINSSNGQRIEKTTITTKPSNAPQPHYTHN